MATSSKKRGLKAFVITLVPLLVISAALLAPTTRSPVSEISARQVDSDNAYPSTIKVAVPFGSNGGILFPVVRHVDGNTTKSARRARANGVRKKRWTQTTFNSLNQIVDSGWSVVRAGDRISGDYDEPLGPFENLGINMDDGISISANQDKEFKNRCQDKNAPTGAVFREIYNVQSRTIIGDYNYGPLFRLNEKPRADKDKAEGLGPAENRLPDIQRWSDITWAVWAELARQLRAHNDLKYIFKHDIRTTSTKGIMELAGLPDDDDDDLSDDDDIDESFDKEWPGIKYVPGQDEFQALLGTPHGKGIVWMLVDHPDELDGKTIESITMFTAGVDGNYNLLFTLTG